MRRARTARDLGIRLASRQEQELFKWFLASLLYGKPIQRNVAERAYEALVKARLLTPDAILRAGWDRLVQLLDATHYVRYDFSTATKLLEVCRQLKEGDGSLTCLLARCRTSSEASRTLQEFKHIGPVTARIFLREVQPVWFPPRQAKHK